MSILDDVERWRYDAERSAIERTHAEEMDRYNRRHPIPQRLSVREVLGGDSLNQAQHESERGERMLALVYR